MERQRGINRRSLAVTYAHARGVRRSSRPGEMAPDLG